MGEQVCGRRRTLGGGWGLGAGGIYGHGLRLKSDTFRAADRRRAGGGYRGAEADRRRACCSFCFFSARSQILFGNALAGAISLPIAVWRARESNKVARTIAFPNEIWERGKRGRWESKSAVAAARWAAVGGSGRVGFTVTGCVWNRLLSERLTAAGPAAATGGGEATGGAEGGSRAGGLHLLVFLVEKRPRTWACCF